MKISSPGVLLCAQKIFTITCEHPLIFQISEIRICTFFHIARQFGLKNHTL